MKEPLRTVIFLTLFNGKFDQLSVRAKIRVGANPNPAKTS